ncbi:MAG TPA: MotA/TolQ/ExbB proton channel family protein [Bacteroidales bacterium]
MKKIFAFLTITAVMTLGLSNIVYAQESAGSSETTEVTTTTTDVEVTKSFHQVLKEKFIEGGANFMASILLTLIFGLAISIERIIYLSLGSVNTKKLLKNLESALDKGGIDGAKKVVRETPGPVASIFSEGLNRWDDGMAEVEKAIVSYGSVVTGRLETGVSWIALFIAIAPMLGFLGTVIGMIQAFENIAAAGDISPTIVASGIQVALLTTVFGLIVAIILQVFYNYIISKIESLVNEMEDSSINFIDMLAQHNKK